jgi:hypothetical protein
MTMIYVRKTIIATAEVIAWELSNSVMTAFGVTVKRVVTPQRAIALLIMYPKWMTGLIVPLIFATPRIKKYIILPIIRYAMTDNIVTAKRYAIKT